MRKTILDDGFHNYLVEGASFVGAPGIPSLMNLNNIQIPKSLIPFEKVKHTANKRQYVHFYMHDKFFADVLTSTKKYVDLLKEFDGVVSPDCTMLISQSPCLLQTSTYFNRAIGYYLQKQGIPVIPNIRWSDEKSFEYCFLGVPKNSIVSISTHGCIRSNKQKELFKLGLSEMIKVLEPTDVLVHGYMPKAVFDDFQTKTNFHRYPSLFEQTHPKKECE